MIAKGLFLCLSPIPTRQDEPFRMIAKGLFLCFTSTRQDRPICIIAKGPIFLCKHNIKKASGRKIETAKTVRDGGGSRQKQHLNMFKETLVLACFP